MRRRTVIVACTIVAMAVGLATNAAEEALPPDGPQSVQGVVGEDIETFPYKVHVNEVSASRSVAEEDSNDGPIATGGVWVIVNLSYATFDEVRSASGARLLMRDDLGREYPISRRAPSDGSPWLAGADTWWRGQLAFEVAESSLAGLTLIFDPGSQIYGPMPTTYAVIPLDIDPAAIAETVTISEPVILDEGDR